MKKDAHKRALKHEKRIAKERKIKQRQLLLKRKLISHAKTGAFKKIEKKAKERASRIWKAL